jgi:transmembrane sensor
MSSPKPIGSAARTTDEEAAAWFARMTSDRKSAADEHEFDAWLAKGPQNARAYSELQELWAVLGGFAEAPDLKAMEAEAVRGHRRWPLIAFGASAALAAAAALAAFFVLPPSVSPPTVYETTEGQSSAIALRDHTTIELGPNSRLVVQMAGNERRAELVRGRAFFDVQHDAKRPFIVRHNAREVRVLGTKFDVDTENVDLAVTLLSGAVEIEDRSKNVTIATLSPNHRYIERNGLARIAAVDADTETAWRRGQLVFDNAALNDVVQTVNRFSLQQIRLADRSLLSLRVSGTFKLGDAEATVSAFEQTFPIQSEVGAGGEIVLRHR